MKVVLIKLGIIFNIFKIISNSFIEIDYTLKNNLNELKKLKYKFVTGFNKLKVYLNELRKFINALGGFLNVLKKEVIS